MPNDFVYITTQSTGSPIAADLINNTTLGVTEAYQRVKLIGGSTGVTEAIPGDSTAGLWVNVKGAGVSIPVSGTVTVQGSVAASGTGLVSVVPGVSVTIQQGASVSAQVSGTVSVSGLVNVTVGPSVSIHVAELVSSSGGGYTTVFPTFPLYMTTGVVPAGEAIPAQVVRVVDLTVGLTGSPFVTAAVVMNSLSITTAGAYTGLQGSTAQLTSGVMGLAVRVADSAAVSGTVSLSGTGIVSVVPGVSVTIQQGASVSAVVSGTVTVSGILITNTAVTTGNAQAVWVMNVTAITVTATVTGGVLGTTATTQTNVTAQVMWLAPTQTVALVSTVGTLLGTVAVNVVAGGAAPGTTAATQSAISAQVVWLAPTQTLSVVSTLATLLGTVNVAAVGTAVVTLATGGTIATLLGTVNVLQAAAVSISSVVPVTTAASVSVSGIPVWLNPTQGVNALVSGTVTVNGLVSVTGTSLNVVASGTVSVSNTVVVTLATGGTLATLLGTVAVNVVAGGAAPGTTAATQSAISAQVIWLAPTQTISVASTVVTVLGTVNVAVVPSAQVSGTITVNGLVSVTGTSLNVVASGTVTVNGLVSVTGTSLNVVASGTVAALDVGRTNVIFAMTSTSVGISGTTMAFTVYQGLTAATAGVTSYVIPAGKTFRVLSIVAVVQNSITTSPVAFGFYVIASTALPTWTSTVPAFGVLPLQAVSQTVSYSGCAVVVADVPTGATVGLAVTIGTSGGSVVQAVVQGYLFP